ncbi:MAG: SMC-Scp complex subunit ScpB [Oscillospiraceae bacterium]|nr:SMC-Scp complex subunit ScpB [Oscillospiraceae bacterium]
MEKNEIMAAAEAILFASGEPVAIRRIAQAIGVEPAVVEEAAKGLAERFRDGGIRLLRLEDRLQLCSAPEYAQAVTRALEQRKPPKLSAAALEVLAIVAYFQPVTRAYIDRVRGVDSSYTVGVLIERGLIEPAGKLEVPGHPTLYRTGDTFLRTMNISGLDELPELPDTGTDEGIIALQNKIEALQSGVLEGQMEISESGTESAVSPPEGTE